jgi:DNA-binding CsgD family transcriptional regulator
MFRSEDDVRVGSDPRVQEVKCFALGALRASACIFYWTDESLQMRDPELSGMSPAMFQAYRDGMERCDPLNVPRLVQSGKRVFTLEADRGLAPADDFDRYQCYLHQGGVRDVIDLIFWSGDFAFAGLGILKSDGDPPICADTVALATTMQRYIEFTFATHPRVRDRVLHQALRQSYRFTRREIEVSDLVRRGFTNHDVAEELGIGLATVKTHIMRIFDKLGIENRASLVARLNGSSR